MKYLLPMLVALCAQVSIFPYCIYYDNSQEVGNISMPIVMYSSGDEWRSIAESQKITKKIFEAVKKGGEALSGGSDTGNAAEEAVHLTKRVIEGAASGGTTEIIGGAIQVLAEPLNVAVDEIIKAAKEKHKHFLTQGTIADCWDWKDIEPWGHDTNKTVFGVIFDQTDQTYLGTFVVDTRGEVHIKIDPSNRRVYLQIWGYDDSVPNTNLKKVFESAGWKSVGKAPTQKAVAMPATTNNKGK